MKRIAAAIVCLLMIFGCTGALAATVTATGDVYVRFGPGMDYSALTSIDEGEVATYLGSTAVDERGVTWFKVFYDGCTGWVSSRYSELDTWSWSYGYITATGNVWVRTGPGLNYSQLGAIEIDDTLEYRNETSVDNRGVAWYKVYYGNHNSAWISSRYAELTTYADFSFVTATGSVNVRSGAGTGYDVLAVMRKDDTAAYLNVSADSRGITWYKVNYGGVTGWVSAKHSILGDGSYGSVEATGDAHLRVGPGLTYNSLAIIKAGKVATYLGETSVDSRGVTWYKVEFEGYTGWISSRYGTLN